MWGLTWCVCTCVHVSLYVCSYTCAHVYVCAHMCIYGLYASHTCARVYLSCVCMCLNVLLILFIYAHTHMKHISMSIICIIYVLNQWFPIFCHERPVSGKTFFPWTGGWRGSFQDDSNILHLLCILFLLLHLLHLRSSGIRFQRLGAPVLNSIHNI